MHRSAPPPWPVRLAGAGRRGRRVAWAADPLGGARRDGERALSRRALLRAAAVGGLGVPLLSGCTSTGAGGGSGRAARDPVSVAMHLHSSFSEGTASMATHLDQARRLGVDVLFWTDHDFRVSAQGYRRRLGLAAPTDTEHGVELDLAAAGRGRRTGEVAYGGGAGADRPRRRRVRLDADAWNSTYCGSLADTALASSCGPGRAGSRGAAVDLSYQPASGGRPPRRLPASTRPARRPPGDAGGPPARTAWSTYPSPAGWSTVDIRPVDDIRALWPDLVAEDNSLFRLRVGVLGTGSALPAR